MIDMSDLQLIGRATKPDNPQVSRELVEGDIASLSEERGTQAAPIKKLRERHHALARSLASGMSQEDAAIACGLTASRVSILKSDPAFKELLNFYRKDLDNTYRTLHEKLAGVASDAVDELSERLEEAPETLTTGQLMEVVKLGADRTGHGPSSSTTNVNVNVDMASKLEAARRRVAEQAKTIEGTTE